MYRIILGRVGSTYHGDEYFKKHLRSRYRVFYDHHLRCYVQADLGDAGSRRHYFQGKYYETFIPMLIHKILRPNDTFIDIGANRGVHTMAACRHLTAGRVISFEPNPRTFKVLEAHVTMNQLSNCDPHNMGLSDKPGTLELKLFMDDAPSGCSFIEKGESAVKETFSVPVERLDRVVKPESLKGNVLVKIDTEGYDCRVVRGMGKWLDYEKLVVCCEIEDEWLRRAGASAQELFDIMTKRGFHAYVPRTQFRAIVCERLELVPTSSLPKRTGQYDLLFSKAALTTNIAR